MTGRGAAVVDSGVRITRVPRPMDRAFVVMPVVTELKGEGLARGVLPDVEIEVVVLKPAAQAARAVLAHASYLAQHVD